MPTTSRASGQAPIYPQAITVSVQLGRNQVVQGLGISMVAVIGLSVAPWPYVAAWAFAAIMAAGAEDTLLRRMARSASPSRAARIAAPALRILATTIYAAAAFVLAELDAAVTGASASD